MQCTMKGGREHNGEQPTLGLLDAQSPTRRHAQRRGAGEPCTSTCTRIKFCAGPVFFVCTANSRTALYASPHHALPSLVHACPRRASACIPSLRMFGVDVSLGP